MAVVPLRCTSTHSLLDGACTPMALATAAAREGMTACALTDSGNLCGLVEWMKATKKADIRPIFGVVSWMEPLTRTLTEAGQALDEGWTVCLLVETQAGFERLCALVTEATRRLFFRPRVPLEMLLEHAAGLTCILPMDHGPLFRLPLEVRRGVLDQLQVAFGERLALEVFDHGIGFEAERQSIVHAEAQARGLPVVATNAVRYIRSTNAPTLDVLHAVALKRNLDTLREWAGRTDQAYFVAEAELRARCGDGPCDETNRIAARCSWAPKTGTFHFPRSEPPEDRKTDEDRGTWLRTWFPMPHDFLEPPTQLCLDKDVSLLDAWFTTWARHGLDARIHRGQVPVTRQEEYRTRLETEIGMIKKMGFSAYLLIVAEFINWAKTQRIAVGPGRGSVAGSLVAWAMRITEVDPLPFGLLFERFLNPARVSMPDVDVDFSKIRREDVIRHMIDRYGAAHVGQIANFGAYGPKSAFKDAARVLRLYFDEANRLSGQIGEADTVADAIDAEPRLGARARHDPVLTRALQIAATLCGDPSLEMRAKASAKGEKAKSDPLLRSRGVHAAGVVVTPRPLTVYAPVHIDPEDGRQVLGTDMDGVDALGLIKFDFLGLKTLDVLEEALDTVERQIGARPDLDAIPLDDARVWRVLCDGDVLGLFQVESSGMEGLLRRLRPTHIEDLIALLALYRPGPLGSGLVEDFVERRHGRAPIEDLHPSLRTVLAPTYGVPVYQEQAMQIAQVLSGYSLADADLLRRAIGKKKADEMAEHRGQFTAGAVARGVSEVTATNVFDIIEKFAAYSFNKCVTGDTRLTRSAAGRYSDDPEIRVDTLWTAWERSADGSWALRTPWAQKLRTGRLRVLQMDEDGRIRPGDLIAVHESGVQSVFAICTEGGHTLRATGNHRLMTSEGYCRIDAMSPGKTMLVVMGEREPYKTGKTGGGHQNTRAIGKTYDGKGVPDGEDNPAWIDGRHVAKEIAFEDVDRRAKGRCELCGSIGSGAAHALEHAHQHSLDECRGDFAKYHSSANIRLLCNSCHKRLDYEKGERIGRWTKGIPTTTDRVIKVIHVGHERTFDIEMSAPNHNFLANGIVSHNSHSASYALITYRTAWLKAHHRAAFVAASCTWESDDHERLSVYVQDAMRRGLPVLPPCVNRSEARFTVEDVPGRGGSTPTVRYGLRAVKGIGDAALADLLRARREAGGVFTSLDDFCARVTVNKRVFESLVHAGALDALESRREAALAHGLKTKKTSKTQEPEEPAKSIETTNVSRGKTQRTKKKKETQETPESHQPGLFSALPEPIAPAPPLAWSVVERLEREAKVLGTWLSGHPLDRYPDVEPRVRTHTIADLAKMDARRTVELVATIGKVHQVKTKRGAPMTFLALSDRTGLHEATVFPEVSARCAPLFVPGACVRVRGALDRFGTEGKLLAVDIETLDVLRARMARVLRLKIEAPIPEETWVALEALLEMFPGPLPFRVNVPLPPIPPSMPPPDPVHLLGLSEKNREKLPLPPWIVERLLGLAQGAIEGDVAASTRYALVLQGAWPRALAPADVVPPTWRTRLETRRVTADVSLFDRAERLLGKPGMLRTAF